MTTAEQEIAQLQQQGGVSAAVQNQINKADQKATTALQGVAIALSVADPVLRGNEVFGLRANFGAFAGQQALGFSAIGVLDQNVFGNGEKLAISAGLGIGVNNQNVGGRIGAQLTW